MSSETPPRPRGRPPLRGQALTAGERKRRQAERDELALRIGAIEAASTGALCRSLIAFTEAADREPFNAVVRELRRRMRRTPAQVAQTLP
jgi:hypothetical protein